MQAQPPPHAMVQGLVWQAWAEVQVLWAQACLGRRLSATGLRSTQLLTEGTLAHSLCKQLLAAIGGGPEHSNTRCYHAGSKWVLRSGAAHTSSGSIDSSRATMSMDSEFSKKSLCVAAQPSILRVLEVRSSGVLLLQGRDATTVTGHLSKIMQQAGRQSRCSNNVISANSSGSMTRRAIHSLPQQGTA